VKQVNVSRWLSVYVAPIGVYQSVAIAGGYGTGREVMEYFSKYGTYSGFYGLLLSAIALGILTAFTFEFARVVRAYDYRTFFKALVGPFWVGFELVFVYLFPVVLAVVASAAGTMLASRIGVPAGICQPLILGAVVALAFFGVQLVERVLVFVTVILFAVFAIYFVAVYAQNGSAITAELHRAPAAPGISWIWPAIQFASYSSVVAPLILYAVRGITTRKEALLSGFLCGVFFMLPGALMHLSFLGADTRIVHENMPMYWVIGRLHVPGLMLCYAIALIATCIATGVGFVQALNDRLDYWYRERTGKILPRWSHGAVAAAGLLVSAFLSQFGIISLIAQGYSGASWGCLLVFVIPTLYVGFSRLLRPAGASASR
jgi:uncharacterized membrane protein YkvI